jgi:diadenosine tetraphosphate (Ap4A) HIT family hydrolase
MEWPDAFYARRRGVQCPFCEQGRPDETLHGVRFFAGSVVDAYLQRAAIQRGYSVVVWRGRHVVEPTELAPDEAALFWMELLRVGRALIDCLEPVKLNYNVLGNSVPHLHAHVIPRYAVDPRPEWPFPFPEEDPPPFAEEELRADADRLRRALSSGGRPS